MANTIVLLHVVILYLLNCNVARASILSGESNNNVPTTEFTPTQFHIQTDDGANRFFKYQTWSGQFRKEKRLDDGSVAGSYGWVDANGMLRVYEYRADKAGYRITHSAMFNVGIKSKKKFFNKDKESLSNKVNTIVKRKNSPFFRTSQQRKNAQSKRQEQKEAGLSNNIFGSEDIIVDRPVPASSQRPKVIRLKRRKTAYPVRKLNRPPLLQFIKTHNTQHRTNLKNNAFLQLEEEQHEIGDNSGSSRLQRRISTPDGQVRMVNVEPLFDDEDFSFTEGGQQPITNTNTPIDHGDDILIPPSQEQPNGKVILNTPYRRRTNLELLRKERLEGNQEGGRRRFNSFRKRQQRKLRRRPADISNGGPFVIKRRRRPVTRKGRIPTTRGDIDSIAQSTNDNGEVGRLSVNYLTNNMFHHENTFEDGERKGQYGYIDPIGVRRVVTYTTGPRAPSVKGTSTGGITKKKENDFYGTNTYFKAN